MDNLTKSIWFCPICKKQAVGITFQTISECGVPFCSDCDTDLEFKQEEEEK